MDESGTPPSRPNPKKPYFTLGAAIIRDTDWSKINDRIHGFKVNHKIVGELKWRFFSPHNMQAENPLREFEGADRIALSRKFAEIIAHSPITIIACVTDVEGAFCYPSVRSQQDLYHFCYKPVSERFQYHLQDVKDLGIMVADHRGRDSDKMLRAHHDSLIGSASRTSSGYSRFIESLFLQDSSHSIGIQIADYVAGAIHRAYSTGDTACASILRPRIRSRNGKIQGAGIIQHPKETFVSGRKG